MLNQDGPDVHAVVHIQLLYQPAHAAHDASHTSTMHPAVKHRTADDLSVLHSSATAHSTRAQSRPSRVFQTL
jgi:hypothetical protein